MRPVTVPGVPPVGTYDENATLSYVVYQQAVPGAGKKRKRWQDVSKRDVVARLNSLMDDWVAAGCPLHQGSPTFADDADARDYGDLNHDLTLGKQSWGDARRGLIQQLGAYCSYCTSRIYSHLHIEHVLPKSTFPSGTLAWANFLLACSSCNSAKSNDPNQGTVPGHPMTTASATRFIRNVAATNYLWPHFNWAGIALPSAFPYTHALKWVTFGGRGSINFAQQVNRYDDADLHARFRAGTLPEDRGLYYRPRGPNGRYKDYVAVEVLPNPATLALNTAAQRVIDLVSLNRIVRPTDASKTVDRRMLNRTTAWFRAHWVRDQLDDALALDGMAQDLYPAVVEQSAVTVASTGFWGVWLQVLGNADLDGTPGQDFLRQCFPGTALPDWTV